MSAETLNLATWAAALCPLVLFLVLVPLTILAFRSRRHEHRRHEAQLTSVENAKARRERGD